MKFSIKAFLISDTEVSVVSLEGVALPPDILGCDPIGESSFLFFPCGVTFGGMAGWEREEVTNVGVDGAIVPNFVVYRSYQISNDNLCKFQLLCWIFDIFHTV